MPLTPTLPIGCADEPYRLPNGCDLYPGGRIRVPAEHIWLIPNEDIERYGLTLGDDYSFGSEVVERRSEMINKHWNDRFLQLAEHVADWSKDPSTCVGCVIVDDLKRVLSLGYNGFPRGVKDDHARLHDRPTKYMLVVHAEANAILNATAPVRGGTIYTWPFPPCSECAKLIIQAGIKRVVYPPFPNEEVKERWKAKVDVAMAMFDEAGIEAVEHTIQGSSPA